MKVTLNMHMPDGGVAITETDMPCVPRIGDEIDLGEWGAQIGLSANPYGRVWEVTWNPDFGLGTAPPDPCWVSVHLKETEH